MEYDKRMRALREDHDLTQEDVGKILGTSQTMYARYERGANEMPIRHLMKLCEFYNISADYMLGYSNIMQPLPNRIENTLSKTTTKVNKTIPTKVAQRARDEQ